MNKNQFIALIVVSNIALLIPTTFFTLAIFEGYESLNSLYIDLGFASMFFIIFLGLLNSILISIKEEMLKWTTE